MQVCQVNSRYLQNQYSYSIERNDNAKLLLTNIRKM